MSILGIDYGRKKVGFAYTTGRLSEPYEVFRYTHTNQLVRRIEQLVEILKIEKIVVGVSEGEMEIETKNFGKAVAEELNLPVEYFDETLSSVEAQVLSREAGIKRSKRKSMEDAYAASLMLQDYLDSGHTA